MRTDMFSVIRNAVAGLAATGLILLSLPAHADEAAEARVRQMLAEAEPILKLPDESARWRGIGELVDKYVDMRRAARFCLGQYARQMTDEQAAVYYPLFEEYVTPIYQNTLSNYSDRRLVVTGSISREAYDIIVSSKIDDPAPDDEFKDVTVHWRFYKSRSGALSLFDAGVVDPDTGEFWLGATQLLGQFKSIIANNGGGARGIDALISELRAELENGS